MIIKCIWIMSSVQTAFVILCSSETCVAAVWMMWVLFMVGESILSIALTQSVAHTRVSCPVLADVGCQTKLQQSGSKADHRHFRQLKRGTFTPICTRVFMA